MYDGATVSLSVVDVKGDEVLALDPGTVFVIDPYILAFEAQLEEFTLGDGDLHLSMLTGHLCLDNIIFCCQIKASNTVHGSIAGYYYCGLTF